MANTIDITINKICPVCKTKTPLRHDTICGLATVVTFSEHSRMEIRIDPDEFLLCPTCINPMRLCIQAQPFDLANHLDSPVLRTMYEKQRRDKENNT